MATIFDAVVALDRQLSEMRSDFEAHVGRVERMFRKGTVTDVDPKTQTYRQVIGLDDDGKDVKGPWVPYAQFAGDRKIHTPPTVGQQFLMISPDGDHEQAHGVPLTFSDAIKSPGQEGDTHVDQLGKTKNTIKDGTWRQEVGSASIEVTDGMIVMTVGGSTYTMTDGKIVAKATKVALVGDVSLGSEDASRELSLKGTIDSAGHVEQGNLATKVKAI